MLIISIGTFLVWVLVLSVSSFLIYQVFKKDPDYLSDDDSSIDDIFYGAYLDVDPQFLIDNNIKQASSIQVSLPMPTTPEGYVRAEVDHLTFIDVPINKILGFYSEDKSIKNYKENKKAEYTPFEMTPESTTTEGLALGLFAGTLENAPDQYSKAEEPSGFGNGGEFAGGGASGYWIENHPQNPNNESYTFDHVQSSTLTGSSFDLSSYDSKSWNDTPSSETQSSYSSSINTSSSNSIDSSSDYSSGTSSFDSGSSDSGSYSSND